MALQGGQEAREEKILGRREIASLIAKGQHIVIVDQKVLRCDPWLLYHPGGFKAIQHMVGRDATDEVAALHSPETRQQMMRYKIGRVEGRWYNMIPPIQVGVYCESVVEESVNEEPHFQDSINVTSSSSSSSSSASISDSDMSREYLVAPDSGSLGVWNRRSDSMGSMSSVSISTQGDLPIKKSVKTSETDGMAFLDAKTRLELKLDMKKYPSLNPAVQDDIVDKYRRLNEKIKAEGLYQCNYTAYAFEVARYCFLFGLMLYTLSRGWYAISALAMGIFWQQLVFCAHDAGHMGITHDFVIDTAIGVFIGDFLGGLSIAWWKSGHNVHHIVTNHPEHDPDVQQMPFFAVTQTFLKSLTSTFYDHVMNYDALSRMVIPLQAYLYYPILCFGRFNLYVLSWAHLISGHNPRKGPAWWIRPAEIVGQAVFWLWYGYGVVYCGIPNNWDRFLFVMISHMASSPLHVQITLSHFAMSTADLGPHESFPQKMLRTTMDVDCPPWLDFVHGGLQFQAIHHLYPRIPRHNLRRTQGLVQQFCEETNIPYALMGFVKGNRSVIGRLDEVAQQAQILAKCHAVAAGRSLELLGKGE